VSINSSQPLPHRTLYLLWHSGLQELARDCSK